MRSFSARTDARRRIRSLIPGPTWARVVLLLLVLFALLRSVLWASVQPAFIAPDEDYHWLYINYLVVEGAFPSLDRSFDTVEFNQTVADTSQITYLIGARTGYTGNPHAVLALLAGPMSQRNPVPPKPRPVLEAPAYYLGGVILDNLLWSKVSVTRMTAIRYYSALLGALTIFFAWLLAAQVLAREWERLAAAAIAATQPILAFSASTITNDVAVALVVTATLACCAWVLRAPPRRRQGIGLGALLSLALLAKATTFSLVVVIAITLVLAWRTWPGARAEVIRMAMWVVGVPIVLAGWWYAHAVSATGSILGERGSLTASSLHGQGLAGLPTFAWQWLVMVYRNYWFDYNFAEVKPEGFWFWLPLVGIAVCLAGFGVFIVRRWRSTTTPDSPQMRQALVLALIALMLFLPSFSLDLLRETKGLVPLTAQGRFLTPAYPCLAVLAVIAIRELTRWLPSLYPSAVAAMVAGAFVFYWHTWIVWVLERFYGPVDGHWLREFWRASFDKPQVITQTSLAVLFCAALATFVAGYVLTLWASRPARPLSPGRGGSERSTIHRTRLRSEVS